MGFSAKISWKSIAFPSASCSQDKKFHVQFWGGKEGMGTLKRPGGVARPSALFMASL